MWAPVIPTSPEGNRFWGLSWGVSEEKTGFAFAEKHRFYAGHTGGAVGASSVLLIYPREKTSQDESNLPQGVVVAIICNLQSVGLLKLATDVAQVFEPLKLMSHEYRVRKIEEC